MAAADLFGSDLDSDDDGEKGSASESDESEQIASPQNPSVASSPAPEKEDQGSRSGSGSRNSSVSSRSGSATPASSRHSSPAQRSRSPSPNNAASHHSGSPRTSRSQSPEETHSQSPKETHSQSPKANRLQSPVNADDRSQTPSGRSRSASPASNASNSPGNRPAKPRKILSSGDDSRSSNGEKETAENVNDLFGDADDLESDEEKADKRSKIDDDENDEERGENKEEHEGEEKEEAEPEPEKRIEVDIPRINPDLGRHIHFVKMPNFLSVETRPFDPKFYEDEIIEDEVMDEEGRTRLKLKVENTVRWRYAMDKEGNIMTDDMGQSMKESNARVVRWSDGSMSLHLGNEIFDIHQMPLQGDFNHLFIRQGTGLQGQAVFKTKLTFRPHSTDSFTHRKVTMSMADRTMKKAHNVKVLPIIGKDPDAQRNEMIKKEEERLRASVRRESQQRRIREKAYQRGINASYLEGDDDDDENAISLSAIKKQFKGGKQPQRSNIYTSESEDSLSSLSDDEPGKRKIPTRAKKIDSNEDDSDAEVKVKKARVVESDSEASDEGKKGSAAAASMDSDDDDDDD